MLELFCLHPLNTSSWLLTEKRVYSQSLDFINHEEKMFTLRIIKCLQCEIYCIYFFTLHMAHIYQRLHCALFPQEEIQHFTCEQKWRNISSGWQKHGTELFQRNRKVDPPTEVRGYGEIPRTQTFPSWFSLLWLYLLWLYVNEQPPPDWPLSSGGRPTWRLRSDLSQPLQWGRFFSDAVTGSQSVEP